MKVLLSLAAIMVAGASALPAAHVAATPVVDLAQLANPIVLKHIDHLKHIAANYESWSTRKQIDNINDFVDMIIFETRAFLVKYGYDPMILPSIDEQIRVAGTPINVKLDRGVIFNTSSIYRDGDVALSYEKRQLVVSVPMFFKFFKINYDYNITVNEAFDATLLQGKLNGDVVVVDVNYTVHVDFQDLEMELEDFNISNMGAISIKFQGGMLEWILEGVTNFVTSQMKAEVVKVVEEVCSFSLTSIFDVINKVLESIKP